MPATRAQTDHFILGHPSRLPPAQFPTNGDVLNHLRWLCAQHGVASAREKLSSRLFSDAADEICEMWDGEGVPRYGLKYVRQKLRTLHQWGKSVNRSRKTTQDTNDKIMKRASQLFDLALCQCEVQAWDNCTCARGSKVPKEEWDFLQDQRGPRLQTLGGRDWATSALRDARNQRREIRARQERAASGR